MKDYRTLLLLLLVVGVLLPAAVSFAQAPSGTTISDEYLLVVGDQIQIVVEGQEDNKGRVYIVPAEG